MAGVNGSTRQRARAAAIGSVTFVFALSVACEGRGADASKKPLSAMQIGAAAGPADASAGPPADQLPPGLTAVAAARLDSGNVAFRARQYAQALAYYRAAARDVPEHPAPWYGVFMVASATNNQPLVDSATQAIASRQGGGDLLNNGMADNHQGGSTPSGLPADHPKVKAGQTSKIPVP